MVIMKRTLSGMMTMGMMMWRMMAMGMMVEANREFDEWEHE
jgi:hypothetical protein